MKTKQNKNASPMKNIFLLLLLITGMVQAQIVSIPDANFKAALLSSNSANSVAQDINHNNIAIDQNGNSEIEESEALNVVGLDVSNSNITDLAGLEFFSNIKRLVIDRNNIISFPIDGLTNLQQIDASQTLIDSLDLTFASGLLTVNCSDCPNLINVNLSGLSLLTIANFSGDNLVNLNLSGTAISTNTVSSIYDFSNIASTHVQNLNISNCLNLTEVLCENMNMQTLNVTGSVNITRLQFPDNQLTQLDVSTLVNLHTLVFNHNNIEFVDLSNNPNIFYLECYSTGVKRLILKNGNPVMDTLMFVYPNPLQYICVDEAELTSVTNQLQPHVPDCVFSTYCSFTPGGNYNTISGTLTFDNNQDGCDVSDVKPKNLRIDINDGSNVSTVFTNVSGTYTTYMQEGNFALTPFIENPSWFTFSPVNATIPFADNNNNAATQDFCITANGIHPDIEVVISPVFFARPGFDANYQITYRNKGNQTVSGAVNLIFDDSKIDFVSASPVLDNLALNSLSWNYLNLMPFESRTITVTLYVNSPTETPAVNIGDILNFEVAISPVVADENPLDNTFSYTQTVVGSYDPNDITCLEGDVVPATEIGNYLHYAINFENTGAFPAENVVVKTEIDATKFDIGSLQLMNTNFPVDARITGNKVEFIFENIQLPIGGHGHILLKIKTQNTLVIGDAVANRGDIFFDYNAPIDTGLANTVFQTLSNSVFAVDNSVAIYPNPAANEVTVKADNSIKSIQLYDAQGRIILTRLQENLEAKIELSSYSKGIYFIKITTVKGAQVQELLKD